MWIGKMIRSATGVMGGPTFHILIVPSSDPAAILELSGDQDTDDTGLTGPVRFM